MDPYAYSDDHFRDDIIAQTAEFRFRICWAGTREVLIEREIDPLQCLLISCDQGDDTHGLLVLPDGQLIDFDVSDDRQTRKHERFTNWTPVEYAGREYDIAREIATAADTSAFDSKVLEHFNAEWRDRDAPLPPVDRIWP
ncbi:MAG: hypothetical protein AAF497_03220 [Planctomycetota bacterium]